MTTCTWDGKRLSADTRSITGDVIDQGPCQKIYSRKGVYVALAGDVAKALPIVEWLLNPKGEKPKSTKDFQAILVSKDRQEYYGGSLKPVPLTTPHAIGSGGDFAIAAMLSGKTGPQAIKIAAKMDPNTGIDFGVRSYKIPT